MKSSQPVYRRRNNNAHYCSRCKKRRTGCVIDITNPETVFHKKRWLCFHCNNELEEIRMKKKEVFNGTVVRECDYCGLNRKCKVTRDGKKICENCEEHNINAQRKIKELEIFG